MLVAHTEVLRHARVGPSPYTEAREMWIPTRFTIQPLYFDFSVFSVKYLGLDLSQARLDQFEEGTKVTAIRQQQPWYLVCSVPALPPL